MKNFSSILSKTLLVLIRGITILLFLAFLFMTLGFFALDEDISAWAAGDMPSLIITLATGSVLLGSLVLSFMVSIGQGATKKYILAALIIFGAGVFPSWISYIFTRGQDALFFSIEQGVTKYNEEGIAIYVTLLLFPLLYLFIHHMKSKKFMKKKRYSDPLEWEVSPLDPHTLIIHHSALKLKGDWKKFNLSILAVSGIIIIPVSLSILRGVIVDLPIHIAEYGPAGILNNAGALKISFALVLLTAWGIVLYRFILYPDLILKFENGYFTAGKKKIPHHEISHAGLERIEQKHYSRIGSVRHPVYTSHIVLSLYNRKGKLLFKYWFMDYRRTQLVEFFTKFFKEQKIELRQEKISEFAVSDISREFF